MSPTAPTAVGNMRARSHAAVSTVRSARAPAAGRPPGQPGAIARRVAPFAPVALGLLAQAAGMAPKATAPVDFMAAVCAPNISGYEECHEEYPTGCSKAAKYDGYLNELKNLAISPGKPPVRWLSRLKDFTDLDGKLPAKLARDNHAQFGDDLKKDAGEGSVAGAIGYLYYAQKGGASESSNCQLGEPNDIDLHIGIGFDAGLAGKLAGKEKLTDEEQGALTKESVIIEMTPHWRARFKPEWSLALLRPAIGHQVRVVGQLLVDNEHYDTKDSCAIKGANPDTCWRASIWELHPVTRFEVCGSGDNCTQDGAGWVDLEEFKAGPGGPKPTEPPGPEGSGKPVS
jgi:hypothetical protein